MFFTIRCRSIWCAGLIMLMSAICDAADKPAGVVTSTGSFRVNGSVISNSATVFEGDRLEAEVSGCTLTRTEGGTIKIDPQSAIVIGLSGMTITRGRIVIAGNSELYVQSPDNAVRPLTAETVVSAQFVNNEFTVDLLKGSARLSRKGTEEYARLGTGARMRFPIDPAQPIGVDLLAVGCLHRKDGHWVLKDDHIPRDVELLGQITEKERQRVEIRGAMQPLPAKSDSVSATVQVLSEKHVDGACPGAFLPIFGPVITGIVSISTVIPIWEAPHVSVP
jgi:hypothetical protein